MGVTVTVVTTSEQRTKLDEDNPVCSVQAVHTKHRRLDQPDEASGLTAEMIRNLVCESREHASEFADSTDVENVETGNASVDVGDERIYGA